MTEQSSVDGGWEALERTINEIDVLGAIYGGNTEEDEGEINNNNNDNNNNDDGDEAETSSSFSVISPEGKELKRIRRRMNLGFAYDYDDDDDDDHEHDEHGDDCDNENENKICSNSNNTRLPEFRVQIRTNVVVDVVDFCSSSKNNNGNNDADANDDVGNDGFDFIIDEIGNTHNDESNKSDNDSGVVILRLVIRFRLPVGYPESAPAAVESIRIETVSRKPRRNVANDEIVPALNDKSDAMVGTESVLDLVEDAKTMVSDRCQRRLKMRMIQRQNQKQKREQTLKEESLERSSSISRNNAYENNETDGTSTGCADEKRRRRRRRRRNNYGRRWIWVHHITSVDRRKCIMREARSSNLTGLLKRGYPGVVLVCGPVDSCDEFTTWIKGNKSRPGGFGRNWGHHVRGEINCYQNDDDDDDDDEDEDDNDDVNESGNNNDNRQRRRRRRHHSNRNHEQHSRSGKKSSSAPSSSSSATTTANNDNNCNATTFDSFQEIDDLSVMARLCKEKGLEDEFKEFVMRHK